MFGAAVPERMPRTRSGRAVKLRLVGDLGSRDAMHVEYRYFSDTWDIKAHTAEIGYSRYFGENWLADAFLRYYSQSAALFYSDNATSETTYVSRNRQLSTFNNMGLGAKVAYTLRRVPGRYDLKLNGSYEYTRFKFKDFTDIRTAACTATRRTSSRSTCRLLTETAMIKPSCKLIVVLVLASALPITRAADPPRRRRCRRAPSAASAPAVRTRSLAGTCAGSARRRCGFRTRACRVRLGGGRAVGVRQHAGDGERRPDAGRRRRARRSPGRSTAASRTPRPTSSSSTATCSSSRKSCCSRPTPRSRSSSRWTWARCSSSIRSR